MASSKATTPSKSKPVTPIQKGGGGNSKKAKKPTLKRLLDSPYTLQWPPISQLDLECLFSLLDRCCSPYRRPRRRKHDDSAASTSASSAATELPSCIRIGINAVTRALERNELAAVIVCRDEQRQIATRHLPLLCATMGAHLVPIAAPPSSGCCTIQLGRLLGLRACSAMGLAVRPRSAQRQHHDEPRH